MTIRTKMMILFSSIVTVLLIVFCSAIYFLSEVYRENEYKSRLKQEALTAAAIFFNNDEISPDLLKLLTKNQMTALYREEIILLDTKNQTVYKSGIKNTKIDNNLLNEIRQKKEIFWSQNDLERFGFVFKNKNQDYVIIASAIDKYGLSKQQVLANLLIFGSFLVILISTLLGNVFVKGMLKPLQQMIKKIDNITASNLNSRLNLKNDNDELEQLSKRFNEMLDRLQRAFNLQKAFVSHVSHELRTPLTAITGQIQVSLLANDKEDDLRFMIRSVLEDVNQLNKLTNNLLELTSIEAEGNNIKLTLLNVLDVLLRARTDIMKKWPHSKILFTIDDKESQIPEIYASESLLHTAFINLIENGVKFSPNQTIEINMSNTANQVSINFQNKTKSLSETDLGFIFEPFMRGSNSKNTRGHGVGLSLTKRIIELHNGTLFTQMLPNNKVQFQLKLQKPIKNNN